MFMGIISIQNYVHFPCYCSPLAHFSGSITTKVHQIGVSGLCAELTQAYSDMSEVLKRLGHQMAREVRKAWENGIRDAETVSELKEPLVS